MFMAVFVIVVNRYMHREFVIFFVNEICYEYGQVFTKANE